MSSRGERLYRGGRGITPIQAKQMRQEPLEDSIVADACVFSVNDTSGHVTWEMTTSDGTAVQTGHYNCGEVTTTWWPNYWYAPYQVPDKTGAAFRIAQKLMEQKIVEVKKPREFCDLVNLIVDVI